MRILERDLDYFTDPFRLDGEGSFSWRTSVEDAEQLSAFEAKAGQWLALYRQLATRNELWTAPLQLKLTAKSTYEEAHRAADWLGTEWQLGAIPAATIERAVRERLRALVLHVDAPEGVSGAACRLQEFSAILVNRNESVGRRNFNLAHELFHVLTWETIRPAHLENSWNWGTRNRSEQLANCFASALLMPETSVREWWSSRPPDAGLWREWSTAGASQYRVSRPALLWRLVQLGLLDKSYAEHSKDSPADSEINGTSPPLFDARFVAAVRDAIDDGEISVRRSAALLGMTIDELAKLFREYSLEVPFDV